MVLGYEQRMGEEAGLGSEFYRPDGGGNKEGKRGNQEGLAACHKRSTAVAFRAWPRHRRPKKGKRRAMKNGKAEEEERKEEEMR